MGEYDELVKKVQNKRDLLKLKYSIECADSLKKIIFIGFVVDTFGNTTDIKIVRGLEPTIDEEARSEFSKLELKWTAGEVRGQKVPVSMHIPFNFCPITIEKKNKKNKKKNNST